MPKFITKNRVLVEAIKTACQKQGISCTFFSDNWIARLGKNGRTHFVYATGFDVNSQAAANIALDKVATYQLLDDVGIAAVPHYLLSTVARPEVSMTQLEELFENHKLPVIKPTLGGHGEAVALTKNLDEALIHIKNNFAESWSASLYLEISRELRLVIYDGRLMLAYEKLDAPQVSGLKMFNLNLGAKPENLTIESVSKDICQLAAQAMQAIGLRLGAVDVVFDTAGKAYILEINSGFSLERYALASPENRRRVINFYWQIIQELFSD